MNIFDIFKKKNNSIIDDIEEFAKQENIKEELKYQVSSVVVTYIQNANNEAEMIKLTDFHNEILPDINSIIWILNNKTKDLVPYKVIRYDYIENNIEETYNKVYIVVTKAKPIDIIESYEY